MPIWSAPPPPRSPLLERSSDHVPFPSLFSLCSLLCAMTSSRLGHVAAVLALAAAATQPTLRDTALDHPVFACAWNPVHGLRSRHCTQTHAVVGSACGAHCGQACDSQAHSRGQALAEDCSQGCD
jgi:hypothetical protein